MPRGVRAATGALCVLATAAACAREASGAVLAPWGEPGRDGSARRALPGGLVLVSALAREEEPRAPDAPDVTAFSVYALSRGKGVPQEAREALQKASEVVEGDRRSGVSVKARRTRIGLEGETRLCVEYACAADAARALERVEKIVKDVGLVNLVRGSCADPAGRRDEKEDEP